MPHFDDSLTLIDMLPEDLAVHCETIDPNDLTEIVMDYGRPLELRFTDGSCQRFERLTITNTRIQHVLNSPELGQFQTDNRAGVAGTLHRISRLLDRNGEVVGLTMRYGRVIENPVELVADLLDSGESILVIGKPGVGKTSLVRQMCRYLADGAEKRVMVVDTSNEIGGDSVVPHPAIGSSRRIMVPQRNEQYNTMVEAVQNHFPEVVVVDEIGTKEEAQACCSIAERGVQIIASAHGSTLESVIANRKINEVIGSIVDAAVSDTTAEKNGGSKFVLGRRNKPAFTKAIEILAFGKIAIHHDVERAVDSYLGGDTLRPERRWIDADGVVNTTPEITAPSGSMFEALKDAKFVEK